MKIVTSVDKHLARGFVDTVGLIEGLELHSTITAASVIHIFGAGVNPEKPAHKAVHNSVREVGQLPRFIRGTQVQQSMDSQSGLPWTKGFHQKLWCYSSLLKGLGAW